MYKDRVECKRFCFEIFSLLSWKWGQRIFSKYYLSSSRDAAPQSELELITAIPNLVNLQPDQDNGAQRIEKEFSETLQTSQPDDTLGQLLDFLKEVKSPISSVLDLRNILVVQKEEKMAMETMIRELKAEMVGLRYVMIISTLNDYLGNFWF